MEERKLRISQGNPEAFLVCDKSLESIHAPFFYGFMMKDSSSQVITGTMAATGHM